MKLAFDPTSAALVVLGTLSFILIFMALGISAMPWEFAYLQVGRLIGPILGLVFLVLILVVILLVPAKILARLLNSMKHSTLREFWVIMKKKKTIGIIVLSLVMSFFIMFSFSLVFMPQVSQAGEQIDRFIAENANLNLQDYVTNVSSFLNDNVRNAYNKPEAFFKIDIQISGTLLDPYIMQIWGVTRADLIVYQGWGTCGQAAILIEELLHDAGYETRQARFTNIDHQWAEVKNNGKWFIIDPWYIGNLVQAQNLKNLKPEFQQASGVRVKYWNGTTVDASLEHGY